MCTSFKKRLIRCLTRCIRCGDEESDSREQRRATPAKIELRSFDKLQSISEEVEVEAEVHEEPSSSAAIAISRSPNPNVICTSHTYPSMKPIRIRDLPRSRSTESRRERRRSSTSSRQSRRRQLSVVSQNQPCFETIEEAPEI